MAILNDEIVKLIKRYEGGWSVDPRDKGNAGGGCTMSGVTLATFRSVYGQKKTCADLKKLTNAQWNFIFKSKYWNRWKADDIKNQSIANLLVDWLWVSGAWGIKYPQRVLGVVDDGIVGAKTIAAINNYKNQEQLFNKLWAKRKAHFEGIVAANPSQKVFLKGWLNRLNAFKFKK